MRLQSLSDCLDYLTNKTWLWGQYDSLRTGQYKLEWYMVRSWGPYSVLAWTNQSVNCILPENTGFICYILPNIWIKRTAIVLILTVYVINQNWNKKGLKSKPFKHFLETNNTSFE